MGKYYAWGTGQVLDANRRLSTAQEHFWDDWRIEQMHLSGYDPNVDSLGRVLTLYDFETTPRGHDD